MASILNAMRNNIPGRAAGTFVTRRGTQVGKKDIASQNVTQNVSSQMHQSSSAPIHATMKRSPSSWDLLALDEHGEPAVTRHCATAEDSVNASWKTTATTAHAPTAGPKKHLPPDPWDFMVLDEFGEPHLMLP